MSRECAETESVLRAYLTRSLGVQEDAWELRQSRLGGRGVFATRDLRPGDLIFHDAPVVWGPRAKPDEPMCAACNRRGRVTGCVNGCYLPVCSPECSTSRLHERECQLVRESMSMPQGQWRLDLVGTVTPLRCLFMSHEDREVMMCMQGNPGKIHGIEVDLLKQHMKDKLKEEDEDWMRKCCLAMDTNSFEFLKVLGDGSQTSLRGLYPLAAMLNNECSPNSCHIYNSEGIMKVFAARPIAAGEEVTTSYSALLWSTNIRRLNLAKTKHFLCHCSRCADATEFGTMLSCLPCRNNGCGGILLPSNPLKINSSWFCGTCNVEVSTKEATQMQATQGAVLQELAKEDPHSMARFLKNQTMPNQCQVFMQLKNSLLWQLGHKDGFSLQELSDTMLDLKEECCRDLILLLDMLRLGFCRMKGLIMLELHATLCEQHRRLNLMGKQTQKTEEEATSVLAIARIILQDDAAAEKELSLRMRQQQQIEVSLIS